MTIFTNKIWGLVNAGPLFPLKASYIAPSHNGKKY
jgi:hypothetical protein